MAVVIRLEFVVCWRLAEALKRRSNPSDPTGIDEGRDGSIAATPVINQANGGTQRIQTTISERGAAIC